MRGRFDRFDPRRKPAEPAEPEIVEEPFEIDLPKVVAALHWDLAEWLGTDALPKVFDRISGALDEKFTSVVTTGQSVDRETLLGGLWSARNLQPGLEIEVSDVQEIARSGSVIVVRFVAENQIGGAEVKRMATGVIITDGRSYAWRSVHETPMPDGA
ncbi:hypothetical protein JK358_33085 [Nocardia sp. 2]|uniref:DUF4440 domain-containing protein n=1 Tax=Nocardia acididurans TaxID=2802282 RepID=A0ABS1MFB1_9NOCA|nr:hypothetical protein [Nocardia acididurans]MBL1079252.1 hypothetical protein [Nocardia acididurans]